MFCFVVGQGLNSGVSVYLSTVGSSATLAGIGVATFSAAAAISRLVCGVILNRAGRARLMVIGAAVLMVATFCMAFLNHDAFFVLWRFFQGFGFALATTAAATAATDVLPRARLGEGIGYYGLSQAIALSVGPALALFLVGTEPAENLFFGLTLLAAIGVVFGLVCRYEKNPDALPETAEYRIRWEEKQTCQNVQGSGVTDLFEDMDSDAISATDTDVGESPDASESSDAKGDKIVTGESTQEQTGRVRRALSTVFERHALAGAIPMLFMAPAFGFGITFMGLLGTSIGIESAGLFYTISAVVMLIVRLSSGRFMDTVIAIRIVTVAIIAGIIAFLLVLSCLVFDVSSIFHVPFYLAAIFYGISLGLALPTNQTVAVRNTPPERWGAANALFFLFNDLGIGIASMVWGVVNDNFGFPVTICCILACFVIAFVLAWICYPAGEKHTQKAR